jgi:hypothetical protein
MRVLIAAIVVLAFAARALVAQGFMPSSVRPFSVDICPDGLPAGFLGHGAHAHDGAAHHHGGTHWQSEHCVFGGACLNGPVSDPPVLCTGLAATAFAGPSPPAIAIIVRLVHLPQVRGPPAA